MQSILREVNKKFVTTRSIRVLIVEDREEDFLYFSFLLQRNTSSTYAVEWASNYQAGLAAINRREHDVALFDYQLGSHTGLDLLRETVASGNEMPVILLTGHDSPEIDREALENGAADYLCKVGLSATQLERSIRYSLRQSAMLSVVRKGQQQLDRHSQLLTGILRNLPIVVGRIDSTGRVIEADGESHPERGIQLSALIGKKFSEVFPQSGEAVAKALGGESISLSLSGIFRDEEWHAEFFIFFDAQNSSGAIFLGRDVTERKWLERRLLSISDAEQQRIGADLHDGLGQHLTGIACLAAALRDRLGQSPKEAGQAATIATLVNEAIAQCRALSRGLCPVQLEHTGLMSALEDLTFQVQLISGVNCRFEAVGTPPQCSHDAAMHVYRITQEAINNAIRHGSAQSVTVSMISIGTDCKVVIEDDGSGFDVEAERTEPGVGLRLMNYRAAIIGGSFSVAPREGGGVCVECTFPKDLSTHENSK